MNTLDTIRRRTSTRAYLDRPVSQTTIESILDAARWAPSGVNTQPWQVEVVTGRSKEKLADALVAAHLAGGPQPDYEYYPGQWPEPYKSRRKASGLALYQSLGITLYDQEKRRAAWLRNYRFFDAPTGLLFFIDRTLATGSWVDTGMFIQNVMLAACDLGLATCPQASIAEYPDVVRSTLDLPPDRALVCGMALGYPDPQAAVNGFRTEREPVSAFTRWHD
jgi:nitroreductase